MPTAEDELIETSRDLYAKAVKASEDSSDIINKGEEISPAYTDPLNPKGQIKATRKLRFWSSTSLVFYLHHTWTCLPTFMHMVYDYCLKIEIRYKFIKSGIFRGL